MTFREIAKEVMISKGMSPADVEKRAKMSTAALPGANVDREIPPEDIPALRKHLSDLHDLAVSQPEIAAAMLATHMDRVQANN